MAKEKAVTQPTVTTKGFDPAANKAETIAERAMRADGDKVKTTPHVVMPGRAVRQGGKRHLAGDTVNLTPADADRLLAKGDVGTAAAGSAAAKAAKSKAEADQADADAAADAQRIADEAAAKQAAADAAARGELSGAENR